MATETEKKTSANELPDHLKIEVSTDKVRTKGWERFDKWVHFGIGFGLNVAFALTMSVFQINRGLNSKIDKANEIKGLLKSDNFADRRAAKKALDAHGFTKDSLVNFANSKKRSEGGFILGKIFDFSEWVHKGTDRAFGVGRDEYGRPVFKKDSRDGALKKGDLMQGQSDRPLFSGIASDVLSLSIPGHVTTAMVQFFEQPWLKPKLVRWFDKKEDEKRIAKGEKITEGELAEREAIYKKLDNELAGKSFIQMWSARFVGIAVVIGSLISFGMIDRKITGADLGSEAGLNRVGQLVTQTGRFVDGGLKGINVKSPQWLQQATSRVSDNPNTAFAKRMLSLVGTEVAGSGITSLTQYATLMFKEFFTDTYKDKKKEAKAEARSGVTAVKQPHEKTVQHVEKKESAAHAKSDEAHEPVAAEKQKTEEKSVVSKIQPRQHVVEKSADHKEAVERTRSEATQHALAGA